MAAPRTLAQIDLEMAKLKALREQVAARESALKRKNETRQKIILGGFLLENDKAAVEKIKEQLKRVQDRKVFGLEPFASTPVPAANPPAKA